MKVQLERAFREVLAVHATLGRLGISNDDLYTLYSPPQKRIFVSYRPGDGREYNVFVPWEGPQAEYDTKMRQALEAWNAMAQPQRDELWRQSEFRVQAVRLIADMTAKGFLTFSQT